MLKLIALLGAMTALTSCSDERRFFPRRDFAERRDFCCEESRFFPRRFGRPPYYYGDRFAPYAYNWNGGYTNAGYRYNEY